MRKNKKNLLFSLFLLFILSIGIGYAYLTSNLTLSGTTKLAGNTWDIHFANIVVNETSVTTSTPATIDTNDNTSIDYEVTLNKPGDFYEFTVDIVNAGSITGKISLITNTGIPTELEDIIDYSIVYTNKNTPVQLNDIINHNSSKNIKVRVYFKEDISNDDLPSDDIDLDLNLSITYTQSNEDELDTNLLIQQLKTENSSCFTKYTGQVTDQVGQTVTASNVYFNKCADKRNIIFNNMCWQMIRTTETGGIKMVYNGELVDGKCESTRGDHKGIVGANNYDSTQTLNAEYLYGDSFTYDITNNTFTLTDTTTATWSASTYENLLGKFTCKNTEETCTTLYNVNGYETNTTTAYISSYTIGDTNYAQIGTSSFNANRNSPAMVGYMFNKVYNYKYGAPTSGSLMGNDVSYSNGTYTLLPASGELELGTTKDDTHHYTCNNTTGTCNKVRYYYYVNYYIELDGEANIDEAVNNMLYNDNVNRYNSSIKGIIDAWYRENMLSKTNMLEDTVYCNARNMINQSTNGWNKDGSLTTSMQFKNYNLNNDLSCTNETDQFAVSNNKAKLTYPVALLEDEEIYNINTSSLMETGAFWWGISPSAFDSTTGARVRDVRSSGGGNLNYVYIAYGLRFVVSLSTGAVISSGSGTESDPFIISE